MIGPEDLRFHPWAGMSDCPGFALSGSDHVSLSQMTPLLYWALKANANENVWTPSFPPVHHSGLSSFSALSDCCFKSSFALSRILISISHFDEIFCLSVWVSVLFITQLNFAASKSECFQILFSKPSGLQHILIAAFLLHHYGISTHREFV